MSRILTTIFILSTANLALAADLSDLGLSSPYISPLLNVEDIHHANTRKQNVTEVCKTFPGDEGWPTDEQWHAFNKTLNGALLKVAPRAAVCHSSWPEYYDAEKCKELIANWGNNDERTSHPTELIYPYFQGWSCLPSSNASTPCTLGGDPAFVVNITSPSQISSTILFAKQHNVRLIIKNTGHDVSGKSTGAGSLSIWTHNLNSIEWVPEFVSSEYEGPALRVGAGVRLGEVYTAADEYGVTVVGGECSTVGLAGGYSAGGGHSPVGGLFGMAADNIVELTAVLPNGTYTHITPSTSPDLFWAFRGGGGSTFGVVTSITVKAHPKIPATVSQWQFGTDNATPNETFWKAITALFEHSPAIADSGSQMYLGISPAAGGLRLTVYSFVAPNKTISDYTNLMQPFIQKLQNLGIDLSQNTTFHASYLSAWHRAFPKIPISPFSSNSTQVGIGSRLLPRANFESAALFNRTLLTIKQVVEKGYSTRIYIQNNSAPAGISNAVNPAYRTSLAFLFFSASYPLTASREQISAARNTVTNVLVPMFKEITPGGGTYMNEADCREDGWQQSFFGAHYARLLRIKNELDPESVLWAKTAVGSEDWYVRDDDGFPEVQVGRLCRRA